MRALSQVPNQWKLTTEAEHTTLCIQWTVDTKMPTLSVSLYAVTPPPHPTQRVLSPGVHLNVLLLSPINPQVRTPHQTGPFCIEVLSCVWPHHTHLEEVRHACTNNYKFSTLMLLRSCDNVQDNYTSTCSESCTHVGPPLTHTPPPHTHTHSALTRVRVGE